jgi:uncharacterized protein YdiU (UPF0061 family)
MTTLKFDNTFSKLDERFFSRVTPTVIRDPWLIAYNQDLAEQLGFSEELIHSDSFLQCASGGAPLEGMEPISQVYSGHQFGQWAGQLGDGRGILLGEINGYDLHLKGAGKTPYSRFADGRAVLRSSIREFLCGEYMHHLGIPTSRALSLVGSSEPVYRESYESAATIIRVAESHIRFGHFEHFHYGKQPELVKELADYIIKKHLPKSISYINLFSQIIDKTAEMISLWQVYGFTHGVMNTDNMSILGLTLDYGPYGFIDDYVADFVCNHSDHQGRYAYDRQPSIGLWNLRALAMAFTSIVEPDALKTELDRYSNIIVKHYMHHMGQRCGLIHTHPDNETIISELLACLENDKVDYHLALQYLGEDETKFKTLFSASDIDQWLNKYTNHCTSNGIDPTERQVIMSKKNPKVILRNHHAQHVITACEKGDKQPLLSFYKALCSPFNYPEDDSPWHLPPSETDKGTVLSCSS